MSIACRLPSRVATVVSAAAGGRVAVQRLQVFPLCASLSPAVCALASPSGATRAAEMRSVPKTV